MSPEFNCRIFFNINNINVNKINVKSEKIAFIYFTFLLSMYCKKEPFSAKNVSYQVPTER